MTGKIMEALEEAVLQSATNIAGFDEDIEWLLLPMSAEYAKNR